MARKRKKKRPPAANSAGPGRRIEQRTVANPYGFGMDRVSAVVDTIAAMRERGQLSESQHMAAQVYRTAFDTTAAIGSVLDTSKTGGSGFGPRGKSELVMLAAEKLNRTASALGMIDGFLVRVIVGEGHSIQEAAKMLYSAPSARDRDDVGRRLRGGLDVLAHLWFGRPGRLRTAPMSSVIRTDDARPVDMRPPATEIEPGAVSAGYGRDGRFKVRKPG